MPGTLVSILSVLLLTFAGCSQEPAWKKVNDRLISEYNLEKRIRDDIPETGIIPNLEPGKVTNIRDIPVIEIAPGTHCRIYWGAGTLINRMTLEPGAEIPRETLPSERIMLIMKGSVEQLIQGSFVKMKAFEGDFRRGKYRLPVREFVYLEKGAENAVKAGDEGAEILEIYCPPRLDYMRKAGAENVPESVFTGTFDTRASIEPYRVYNYYDVQFTGLEPDAHSRLISGGGAQLSFLRMNPGANFPHRTGPEEQIMIVLRGQIDKTILGDDARMEKGDILLLPGGMVNGGTAGSAGSDVLDVFWPVRHDYTAEMEKKHAVYHEIIPEDAAVELVADGSKEGPGILYSEGPSWMNGKLYFSSFFFNQDYHGDPGMISFCEMDPDGAYRHIFNESTNGSMPIGNGNIAVVVAFKRQIVEMTPKGEIVKILVDSDAIASVNDLVFDDLGGIYFTDHIGGCAFYMRPDNELIRIIDPTWHGMINGILLSPDGRTLIVSNTSGKFVYAYDVNGDGTVSNEREFAELFLSPRVLDKEGKGSGADGMAMDVHGNIYVSTSIGIQIFSADGEFIGIIYIPVRSLNCCFGGDDMQTLYATCFDRIYRIRTNVKGLEYRLYK